MLPICVSGNFPRTYLSSNTQSVVTVVTREGHIHVSANAASVREAGYSLRFVQQRKVVGCCPGSSHRLAMLCYESPCWRAGSWSCQHTDWGMAGNVRMTVVWVGRFVGEDVNYLISCNLQYHAQPLTPWLLWRLFDQCLLQLLVDKCGKAAVPAPEWPS